MELNINYFSKPDVALTFVLDKLPMNLASLILNNIEIKKITTVNEIRLHANSYISLLHNNSLVKTDIFVSKTDLEAIFLKLCGGSVYAHFHTIKDGYISIGNGIRIGISGRASVERGEIQGIYDITSLNIRIPKRISFAGEYLFSLLSKDNFLSSIIMYSAPGVGKTTILRDLVTRLSVNTTIRFSVIDSREEITPFLDADELCGGNIYLSYPKDIAIEQATKSMTPQLIICDEISSSKEANAIIKATNSGVGMVVTTHAKSFDELCHKEILKPFFKNSVFDYALGITRNENNTYKYELNAIK